MTGRKQGTIDLKTALLLLVSLAVISISLAAASNMTHLTNSTSNATPNTTLESSLPAILNETNDILNLMPTGLNETANLTNATLQANETIYPDNQTDITEIDNATNQTVTNEINQTSTANLTNPQETGQPTNQTALNPRVLTDGKTHFQSKDFGTSSVDSNWQRKANITIDHTKVDADLTWVYVAGIIVLALVAYLVMIRRDTD